MNVKNAVYALLLPLLVCACSKDDQPPVKSPKGVILKSVTIRNIPSTNSKGNAWDNDGSGPDLRFSIDDNRGNWVFQSDVFPDADLTQSFFIDFVPDITVDTVENGQYKWELGDEDTFLGSDFMTGNFIYYSDYSRDSVILSPQKPRVVMKVEYLF